MSHRILRRYVLEQLLPPRTARTKTALHLNIDLPILWYENDAGERWLPPDGPLFTEAPPGFRYQHSRFPRTLIENVLRVNDPEEIARCPHTETLIDHDLIPGLEGRLCRRCGGHQTKPIGTPWPSVWETSGSRPAWSGTSSYPADIVLAMIRPTPEEQARAKARGYQHPAPAYEQAILLTATACGRCLNVLSWQFGLPDEDGYEEGSSEWLRSGTVCRLCT